MIRNPIVLKSVAVFLILETVFSIVSPTVSWALTAGPTSPEFSNFEPVDSSDMVNLSTGDLAYSIPLMEVPGPSGGYPLTLAYHAGILPGEEASWVGLGWSLTPGSINRMVNGYPDDQSGTVRTRVDHNSGGETNTYSIGVGYGGVTANLDIADDSNQGVQVGGSLGMQLQEGEVTVGASFGIKPGGGSYLKAGASGAGVVSASVYIDKNGVEPTIGASTGQAQNGVGIGLQTNFEDLTISASAGGATSTIMSTKGGSAFSMSYGGASIFQRNAKAGTWTTDSWGITIPVYYYFTLGYNYRRYYSHEESDVKMIGSIHASESANKDPNTWSFDSYALIDPEALTTDALKDSQPEKQRGGSFPSYDSYSVNAQGLNGGIQPYIFENGNLFRQNWKKPDGSCCEVEYKNTGANFTRPVYFRFKNDFSNSFGYDNTEMQSATGQQSTSFNITRDSNTPEQGIANNGRLAGSKHIEYFTNDYIRNGFAKADGFIDDKPYDQRNYDPRADNQIGGLSITNESGVTYHYAIPVYESGEFYKSFKEDKPNDIFQTIENSAPYAYTWLLTAVTGPDYYDKNDNGLADNGDWGYWVDFDYGLWAPAYRWRNPDTGFHSDLNSRVKFFSQGVKEVYYLDAIKTQSHVAVFEKETRPDGRALAETGVNPRWISGIPQVKALRLKNVYLMSRNDYESIGGDGLKATIAQSEECSSPVPLSWACNVFDELDDYQLIKSRAIRVVNFGHSFELQPGTPNSFLSNDPNTLYGKLTLKSLSFLGKSGFDGIPPIKFEYGHNQAYNKDAKDIWGYYKSDYVDTGYENVDRRVSEASAQFVDAWSLTKIRTSLGATVGITYESDTYRKPVLYKSNLLTVSNVQPQPQQGRVRIFFHNPVDISKHITRDSRLTLKGLIYDHFSLPPGFLAVVFCDNARLGTPGAEYRAVQYDESDFTSITDVTSTYVEVECPRLYNDMTLAKGQHPMPYLGPYPRRDVNIPCMNVIAQEGVDLQVTYDRVEWDGGNLGFYSDYEQPGGGVRVKSVSLTNLSSTRNTKYSYERGTTSYEPFGLDLDQLKDRPTFQLDETPGWPVQDERHANGVTAFLKLLQNGFSNLLFIAREVPPPGVIYEQVIVEEEIKDAGDTQARPLPGRKEYRYDVFDQDMVQRLGIQDVNSNGTTVTQPMTINDFSTWVGALRSVTIYGPSNQILAKTENEYLHDNKSVDDFKSSLKTDYANQGAITQIFNEYRRGNDGTDYRVFSKRTEYPLVSLKQKSTSYRTNITTTSTTLAFDFYTGAPIKTLSTDGYGNAYVSETVPAYTIPVYSGPPSNPPGMGLKVRNPGNRHMLSQVAKNIVYKVDPTNPSGTKKELVSYSIQTWSPKIPILEAGKYSSETTTKDSMWKKLATYGYIGDPQQELTSDGLLPLSNNTLPEFNTWKLTDAPPASNSGWLKSGQVTLYAAAGQALEGYDLNGQYAATQFTYDQSRVLATSADVKYGGFIYAGAEEDPVWGGYTGGMVYIGYGNNNRRDATRAHTGIASLKLNNGQSGFTMKLNIDATHPKLHISTWVHQSNATGARFYYRFYNGATPLGTGDSYVPVTIDEAKKSGEWYLFETDLEAPAGVTRLEGGWNNTASTVWIDDFRIHPVNSPVISYVYNNWGELSYILDANNLFTRYEYDEMGRLKEVYRESFRSGTVKTGKTIYHYANQND